MSRTPSFFSVEDLVIGAKGAPLIVVLDGIEDPHNVGAILRTVDAAGADGVVRQSRHAARLDGAAAKASAGAVSHVKIAEVVNIARALENLKDAGVWTVGLAGDAPKRYDEVDLTLPTAARRRRRGVRPAPAGPRALRLARLDSDAGARPEPERVGGDRHRAVRGTPAATPKVTQIEYNERLCNTKPGSSMALALYSDGYTGCSGGTGRAKVHLLSGWRSSGR